MHRLVLLIIVLALGESHGETSLGKCPSVDPMPGFNMRRFLGLWYTIQTTAKASPCLSYYFAQDDQHEGQYTITEIEQHSTVWSSALHHEHNITGELTVPDLAHPGRMDLDLPLDIGTTAFTIFLTDYDNYAAIFTCKKLPLIHRWSAKILSKSPALDMVFVDKVRTRLSSYNIDPFSLKIVSQKDCPKPGAKGGLIKATSNAITNVKEKVSDVVDSVGETISDLTSDRRGVQKNPTLGDRVDKAQETVSEAVGSAGQSIDDFTSDSFHKARGTINDLGESASKVFHDAGEKIQSFSSSSANSVREKVSGAIDNVRGNVSNALEKISDGFDDAGDRLRRVGS